MLCSRSEAAGGAEILVLCQQLAVLHRRVARPKLLSALVRYADRPRWTSAK
jgi:hypothetical protein